MDFPSLRRSVVNLAGRFNLVIALLLLVGLALLSRIPSGLGHSLGEAVLIASILGASVDFYLKRRILREATLDISKFLIGYTLPSELQSQIKELMETSLLRRDYALRYEITPRPGGRCTVKVEGHFTIENFTNKPQPYTQGLAFEVGEEAKVTELRLDTDDQRAGYCLREGAGLIHGSVHPVRVKARTVLIEPKSWGKTYHGAHAHSVDFPSTYADIISFANITSRVVLHIVTPQDGLEVAADHSETDVVANGRTEYRRVFLPAQHIRIRWKPTQMNEGGPK